MLKRILPVLLSFCAVEGVCAGDLPKPLKILNRDIAATVTAPARFDSTDWLTAGGIAGVAVLLYSQDGEIRDMFQRNRGGTTNAVEDVFKSFGRIETAVPAFALVYVGARHFHAGRLERAAALSLESFIISGLIFQTVKFTAHRDRPYENSSPYKWHGPGFYDSAQSFPSGDAATAFALLTPVAHVYGDVHVVPPLAYGAASLASLGRINHNDHWASDVFVGAALGYFTAKTVIKCREADSSLALLPVLNGESRGVVLARKF